MGRDTPADLKRCPACQQNVPIERPLILAAGYDELLVAGAPVRRCRTCRTARLIVKRHTA
jgi:hypothetical protein